MSYTPGPSNAAWHEGRADPEMGIGPSFPYAERRFSGGGRGVGKLKKDAYICYRPNPKNYRMSILKNNDTFAGSYVVRFFSKEGSCAETYRVCDIREQPFFLKIFDLERIPAARLT